MPVTLTSSLAQTSTVARNLEFEDFMDTLDIFDPAATPIFSLAKTEKGLDDITTSWDVDKYLTPQGALGYGDGYALQASEIQDVTSTIRKMANGGQMVRVGYGAGWIAEKVPKTPGIGKGVLKQGYSKMMIQIKQSMDVGMGSFDQAYNADQGGANGGVAAGLRKMIDPANAYPNANAMVPGAPTDIHSAPAAACVTGALADVWNLSLVKSMVTALYNNVQRERDYWLLCNTGLRQAVSGLTDPQALAGGAANSVTSQERVFFRDQDDETFGTVVTVVQTDFGRLRVMSTTELGTTTTDINGNPAATRAQRVFVNQPNYGYIIPAEKLGKRFGFPIFEDELGHDGSGITKALITYWTLVVRNPMGFGFIAAT